MSQRFYIQTFGCQMNEYDSDKMADVLRSALSAVPADTPEDADILLLNTCSIREKAQEKVFSQLGRWRAIKDQRPELVIGVGGCVASQEGEALVERAPFVDVVFGPQTLHQLAHTAALDLRFGLQPSFSPHGKPAQPASPHPLTPSALVLAGTGWLPKRNGGACSARGMA